MLSPLLGGAHEKNKKPKAECIGLPSRSCAAAACLVLILSFDLNTLFHHVARAYVWL